MEFAIILLIFILIFFIGFDLFSRKKNSRLLCHLIITNSYYEKVLLLKKIISQEDVAETRRQIKDKLGKQNYEKVKEAFLNYDMEYLRESANIISKTEPVSQSNIKKIKDLLYHNRHAEAMKLLTEINREKAKNSKKSRKA